MFKEKRLGALINYLLLFFMLVTFGLSGVVVLILATLLDAKAEPILQSHYQYQARTFWIGIVPVLATQLIGAYLSRQGVQSPILTYILVLACLIWLAGRVIMGFNHLFHSRPIPNPKTLFI